MWLQQHMQCQKASSPRCGVQAPVRILLPHRVRWRKTLLPRNTIANIQFSFSLNTNACLPTAAATVESGNQAVQFGPRDKPSGPPVTVEPGSNVAQAADILVALSTPREKGM